MIFLYLLGVILAGYFIWIGSGKFELATDFLGRNLSDGVKGASLNAIASSMPELLTGFVFLFYLHGSDGYSGTIGTTAGSAVFNSLLIPSLVILSVTLFGIAKSIKVSKKVIYRDGIFLLGAEIALIAVISTNRIGVIEGLILVMIYVLYFIYMFVTMSTKKSEPSVHKDLNIELDEVGKKGRTAKYVVILISSTIFMALASWLLVYCVVGIGDGMGIHLMFVSIILAAAASSIPDTFISIRDARKGNYDDAVSNALGSNIFDICIAHGLPLALYTMIYGDVVMTASTTTNSIELRVWLLILTAITIVIYLFNRHMTKWTGFGLILLYGVFFIFVLGRAMDYTWAAQIGEFITSFRE